MACARGQIGHSYFQYKTCIKTIDWKKKIAFTQDGSSIGYDQILSTIRCDLLGRVLFASIEPVLSNASKLLYSHSHIVCVGLKGAIPEQLSKKCWMYFPEDNCPFYRVTVFSITHPTMYPSPKPESIGP